ncbi:hypothetical protein EDD86DRAFT_245504 [Gorgonomyces haynaldii]|nr:hypothetical protein EDD86DRAFT_245504 [Gorgonomyces haynaldii]
MSELEKRLRDKSISLKERYQLLIQLAKASTGQKRQYCLDKAKQIQHRLKQTPAKVEASKLIHVPLELLSLIFRHLELVDLLRLEQTCRKMRALVTGLNFMFMTPTSVSRMSQEQLIRYVSKVKPKRLELLNCRQLQSLNGIKVGNLTHLSLTNNAKIPPKTFIAFLSDPALRKSLVSLNLSRYLKLDDNALGRILYFFHNLERLDVSFCRITDQAFKPPDKIAPLKHLNAQETEITNQTIHELKRVQKTLISLNVRKCKLNKASLLLLKDFQLKELDLTGLDFMTPSNIAADTCFQVLFDHCHLNSFSLTQCPYLTNDMIICLLGLCPVETLIVDSSARLTSQIVPAISVSKIKQLSLGSCPGFGTADLINIISSVDTLESINLSGSRSVNTHVVDALVKSKVDSINVSQCSQLESRDLLKLASNRGDLKSLVALDNPQLTVRL